MLKYRFPDIGKTLQILHYKKKGGYLNCQELVSVNLWRKIVFVIPMVIKFLDDPEKSLSLRRRNTSGYWVSLNKTALSVVS